MIEFPCKFCGELCTEGEYDGVYSKASTIYLCNRHPVTVTHYVDITSHKQGDCDGPDCCPKVDWHNTCIYLIYQGEHYAVNWFHGNERYPGPRFRVDWNDPDGKGGWVLFDTPFHPKDVTPETVKKKLPTWLTFM